MIDKTELKNKYVLDACCSVKAMWYDKNHPNVVYIDIRKEESGFLGYGRKEELSPTYVMDFRKMEFPDKTFKLVVFEPPHLSKLGKTSYFRKKFGCLNAETWQDDLKKGFAECWRVLDNYGTLVFKWSNSEIPFKKALELIPHKPLFYNTTNYKATSKTKWFCFMKIPSEEQLIAPSQNSASQVVNDEHNISLKDNSLELSQISSNDETSLNNNIKLNPVPNILGSVSINVEDGFN